MRVLMLAQSPVAGDFRVLREATTLASAGYDVHIVGRDVPEDFMPPPGVTVESVGRVRGLRFGTEARRPARDSLPVRAVRWLLLPQHRHRVESAWSGAAKTSLSAGPAADVVHAHDFNTLELGAELAALWNAHLVYDSHELWFSRALPGRPELVRQRLGVARERRLAAQASVVLTVSEGIADRMRDAGMDDVRVVRNTFPMPELASAGPSVPPRGVVYAGRIGHGRDLETVTEAGSRVSPLRTVLVGPVEAGFGLRHADSVDVLPATSVDEVDRIYRDMGIAVVPLTGNCDNHRLALPNKLFHAVRAGVPVVAADLPAIRQVVTDHRLGRLFRPGDAGSLVTAIRELVASHHQHVRAVREARAVLNWKVDADVLLEVYGDLEL
jgi:glycogen synthase